ncbi:MAG: Integral membrane protein, partial [uncultured Nocardioides sp.]
DVPPRPPARGARLAGPHRDRVGPGRRGRRQGALRRDHPDLDGVAAPGHQRPRPGRRGATAGARTVPPGLADGARLRGEPGGDELGDLPVVRADPPRHRGHHRVHRAAGAGRRRLPPGSRPALGPARRRGRRPPRLRARGTGPRGDRLRPARRRGVGGVHPAEREHRPPLARAGRAGRRERRRDRVVHRPGRPLRRHDPARATRPRGRGARRAPQLRHPLQLRAGRPALAEARGLRHPDEPRARCGGPGRHRRARRAAGPAAVGGDRVRGGRERGRDAGRRGARAQRAGARL